MSACPSWCTREHRPTQDFHKSVPATFVSERRFCGEHPEISMYAEQYINEDGSERDPAVVIDGELSENQDLAEFSLADAARVAAEIGRLLQMLQAVPA